MKLTKKEIGVLDMYSNGLTQNSIAEILQRSPHTISNTFKRISKKLGSKNAHHSLAIYLKNEKKFIRKSLL